MLLLSPLSLKQAPAGSWRAMLADTLLHVVRGVPGGCELLLQVSEGVPGGCNEGGGGL